MDAYCEHCGGTDGYHTRIGCPGDEIPKRPATPETPELDRRSEILATGAPQALEEFVHWLTANGYAIVQTCEHPEDAVSDSGRCWVCNDTGFRGQVTDYERLFARSFDLDPAKIEAERRALLEALR